MVDQLRLRQDVGIIFIVTEEFKARLLEEYKAAEDDVTRQIEQFDFRARHALAELQRADLNRAMAARQQIEAEKHRLEAIKHEIAEQNAQIGKLTIGEEFPRGTIEGVVDVKIGDNLFEKLAGVQVVVRNGVVEEIRQVTMGPEDVIIPQPRAPQP